VIARDLSAGTDPFVRERTSRRQRLLLIREMLARHGAQAAVGQPYRDAEATLLLLVQDGRERFAAVGLDRAGLAVILSGCD
jgi:hypothetical protein